jgi:hypothetical protein
MKEYGGRMQKYSEYNILLEIRDVDNLGGQIRLKTENMECHNKLKS